MIDVERFGGRRSFVLHLMARALTLAGAYSPLVQIDWNSVERLVFVCKGNLCRSPYAVMRARELGMAAVSYGLDTVDDAPADPDAIRNASARKLDLLAHRSRSLRAAEIREGDLVLFFEPQQLLKYRKDGNIHSRALSLVGLWTHPKRPYIADPYGKSDRYFQECFSVIDASVCSMAERIQASA